MIKEEETARTSPFPYTQKDTDRRHLFKTVYGAMISVNELSDQEVAEVVSYCRNTFKKGFSIK